MDYHELSPEEEALYDMSDEELENAFREAKNSVDDEIDEIDEEVDNDVDDVEENEEDEEGTEDELDEDLEQPDEDSDDDTSNGEDETEDDIDEEPEDTDEDLEDKPADVEDKVEDKPKEPSRYKVKANGQEYDLTDEELVKLAPKAFDYTKKMQEIAPWRKTISALKDNDLSHNDVNLMIDAMKGDKDAIATLMKTTGVDALDIDTENVNYVPKEYGRSEDRIAIDDVVDSIKNDPEYKTTEFVVDRQWDDASRQTMATQPELISALHADIKSGIYDKVSPVALKLKALDGGRKSDIEYYVEAGSQYYGDVEAAQERAKAEEARIAETKAAEEARRAEVERAKAEQTKRSDTKQKANKRKAAATTKSKAGKKDVVDYLDDTDEAFDEWYKKLQANM